MGAKAKKSLRKKLTKASQLAAALRAKANSSDFLPLEGGLSTQLPEKEEAANKATVIYIGHIPHGFYEEQMEGFFKQFGKVRRIRIARSTKTGGSKHYGFVEFVNPEVAKVVADEIHNYLVFEHSLQIHLIPPERVHPKLWRGVGWKPNPLKWKDIERKRLHKERTVEEHQRFVQGILKRDEKRRQRIKNAGIEYECPPFENTRAIENTEGWPHFREHSDGRRQWRIVQGVEVRSYKPKVGQIQPANKKIKFTDDEE